MKAYYAGNYSVVGPLSTSIKNCLIRGNDKLPDDLQSGELDENWTKRASVLYRDVVEWFDQNTQLTNEVSASSRQS